MKVVACIPVYGRRRMLSRTLTRLYQKNGVYKVICAGSGEKDKMIAQRFGAEWVEADNSPLGEKWNKAFMAAEKHDPDACLYIGSDDFLEDNWFDVMEPHLKKYDMVGTPDFTMCDIRNGVIRVAYCGGYPPGTHREGEPIGGGRMLTAKLLKGMNWRPFDSDWEQSMDYSMKVHADRLGAKIKVLPHKALTVLALSSNAWATKHNYEHLVAVYNCHEYDSEQKARFLEEKFPEALSLFDDDKWEGTKK